jgi:hypothetical protein
MAATCLSRPILSPINVVVLVSLSSSSTLFVLNMISYVSGYNWDQLEWETQKEQEKEAEGGTTSLSLLPLPKPFAAALKKSH